MAKVKIEQAGGKYGSFECPICKEVASYKFTSASGWCDNCNSTFAYTGGEDLIDTRFGKMGPHWMELQVDKTV